MKKILSVLVCVCLLLSAMVITASAAETAGEEITLTVDSLGLASNNYSADTATVGGADFEWVQLGNYGDGIQVRDKNGNTSTLWNTTAFGAAIKEIKLVYSSTKDVTYSNANAEIFSFGNAAGTYDYSTKLSTTAGVKEYTITPDAETYTFFKFEHDLGYTFYWDSITIVLVADDTTSGDEGGDAPATTSATYTFTDYLVDGELGGGEVVRELDSNVTLTISSGWISGDTARIYKNANAIIASKVDIKSIVINAGNKTSTFDVYTSTDGETWTMYQEDVAFTSSYADVSVTFETPVKFIKIDAPNAQVRMKYLTVNFVGTTEGGEDVTPPAGDEGGEDVTPPAGDEGGEDVTPPADDATLEVVDTPVAGTAYKFGMVQGNLGKTLYLTGEMDSFYYATTEDEAAAADVYLEETTGGYNIYAMVDGVKKYLNIVEAMGSDGKMHTNAVFGDTAVSVYTYDETIATFVTAVGDKSYGFGTRNDREYTTISPCASTYVDNFFCKFYAEPTVDDGNDDVTPPAGDDNNDDTTGDDNNNDGTTGDDTTGGTTTDKDNANTDDSTTSPDTGDNMGAVVALAMVAGVALVFVNKKR